MDGEIATKEMSNQYLYIKADGRSHSASRLAWELIYGEIPTGLEIDHINRIRDDNRIINLRLLTRKENLKRALRNPGVSGHHGISIYNRPTGNGCLWRTRIGKTIYYQSLEEAIAGYAKLASEACD